jgi:hypothetical protein
MCVCGLVLQYVAHKAISPLYIDLQPVEKSWLSYPGYNLGVLWADFKVVPGSWCSAGFWTLASWGHLCVPFLPHRWLTGLHLGGIRSMSMVLVVYRLLLSSPQASWIWQADPESDFHQLLGWFSWKYTTHCFCSWLVPWPPCFLRQRLLHSLVNSYSFPHPEKAWCILPTHNHDLRKCRVQDISCSDTQSHLLSLERPDTLTYFSRPRWGQSDHQGPFPHRDLISHGVVSFCVLC